MQEENLEAGRQWCEPSRQHPAVGVQPRRAAAGAPGAAADAPRHPLARSHPGRDPLRQRPPPPPAAPPEPAGQAPQPVIRAEHPPPGCFGDWLTHRANDRGAGAPSCCACCTRPPGPQPAPAARGLPDTRQGASGRHSPTASASPALLPARKWNANSVSGCLGCAGARRLRAAQSGRFGRQGAAGAAGSSGDAPLPLPGGMDAQELRRSRSPCASHPAAIVTRLPSRRAVTALSPDTPRPGVLIRMANGDSKGDTSDWRWGAEITSLSRLKSSLRDSSEGVLGVSVHWKGPGIGKAPPERTAVPAEGTLLKHPS